MMRALFAFARISCSSRSAGTHAVQAPALHVRRVCYRDEWRGEPRRSSKSEGGLASAQFRFDTPQLDAGSFIHYLYNRGSNEYKKKSAKVFVFYERKKLIL
jgi:hypothetical protein